MYYWTRPCQFLHHRTQLANHTLRAADSPFLSAFLQLAYWAGLEAPLEQDVPEFPADEPLSPVPQGPANSPPRKHRAPQLANVTLTSDTLVVSSVVPAICQLAHEADTGMSTESLFTIDTEKAGAVVREEVLPISAVGVNAPRFEEEDANVIAPHLSVEAEEDSGVITKPSLESLGFDVAQENVSDKTTRFQEEEQLEEGEEDLLAESTDSEWAAIRILMAEEEAPDTQSASSVDLSSESPFDAQGPDGASEIAAAGIDANRTTWGPGHMGTADGDKQSGAGVYESPERTFSGHDVGPFEEEGLAGRALSPGGASGEAMATGEAARNDSKSPRKKGVLSGVASWLKRKSPTKAAAPEEFRSGECRCFSCRVLG